MGESVTESVMSDCAGDGDRPETQTATCYRQRRGADQALPETGGHFISSKYNGERLNHCVEKSYKNIKFTLCENIYYECARCI